MEEPYHWSRELFPAQPAGPSHMARIFVINDGPEPGWSGPTHRLRIRFVRTDDGSLAFEETFGPLLGHPGETGLTDEDAAEISDRIQRFAAKMRDRET